MLRNCDDCGTSYQAKRATSRFCSTRCRTRQTRKRQAGITTPVVVADLGRMAETPLTDATRSELMAQQLHETADGILLLTLAARIDAGAETSPALSSLSKEYSARKVELLPLARTAKADPFDELQAMRERRRA